MDTSQCVMFTYNSNFINALLFTIYVCLLNVNQIQTNVKFIDIINVQNVIHGNYIIFRMESYRHLPVCKH